MAAIVVDYSEVESLVGREVGPSAWCRVTQAEVDAYAGATNDHQWFCEDVERAKRESPYGTTVAPGYFILALVPGLLKEIWYVAGARIGVNYGIDKLRFPAPLPVGGHVRLRATLASVRSAPRGRDVTLDLTLEATGQQKPVCVAQVIYRFLAC